MSEALRWLIHQSILLTTILLENPEVVKQAKKVLLGMPHMKEVEDLREKLHEPTDPP